MSKQTDNTTIYTLFVGNELVKTYQRRACALKGAKSLANKIQSSVDIYETTISDDFSTVKEYHWLEFPDRQ